MRSGVRVDCRLPYDEEATPSLIGPGRIRSQSAMEYLMTYGWAILIIAVVLAALFSLGLFSPSGATGCISNPGFLCQTMVFSSNTNIPPWFDPSITFNFGIVTSGWSNVYLVVVPQGQVLTDTNIADEANNNDIFYWGQTFGEYNVIKGQLQPFQNIPVTIWINPIYPPVGGKQISLGTQISGTIWAMYTPTGSTSNVLAAVANFRVTATS
jgi:hypothetical protein